MIRHLEIVVISDLHLGTYGCQATALLNYLNAIQPKMLILNGDIIDIWQFKKKYFPDAHLQVLQRILQLAAEGTTVYYLLGNHDEKLRFFSDLKVANLHIRNQLELIIGQDKYWVFHGDVFDISVHSFAKRIAKLGAIGYDNLVRINRTVNRIRKLFRLKQVSFSKKIKHSVKNTVKHIQNFEHLALQNAYRKGCDYIICGHLHQPIMKQVTVKDKKITYLNSGDWIEHLTALEYAFGKWELYEYDQDLNEHQNPRLYVNDNKSNIAKPVFSDDIDLNPIAAFQI